MTDVVVRSTTKIIKRHFLRCFVPLNDIYTCQQISDAFNNALDYLGNSSKEALLHMLTTEKGIRFAGRDCSRIEEIEQALYEIFDHGAEIILNLFNNQLAKS